MPEPRMNSEMARVYHRSTTEHNIQEAVLPEVLVKILDEGLIEHDGAVLLKACCNPHELERTYYDLIDKESSINHVHIESCLPKNTRNIDRLWVGIKYARALEALLSKTYPGEHFEINVGTDWESFGGCVVRFVKLRDGAGWLSDDLEGYQENGVFVLTT